MFLSELVNHFKPFPEVVIFDIDSQEEISFNDPFDSIYEKWCSIDVLEWESYFNSYGKTVLCITNWEVQYDI